MATLTAAETCRKVADIIDFKQERFSMAAWEFHTECGTQACIAGHVAILHNDGIKFNSEMAYQTPGYTNFNPNHEWKVRQGRRLGLTSEAAMCLFAPSSHIWRNLGTNEPRGDEYRYSKVLRRLEKELEHRDSEELVVLAELESIANKALL